MLIQINEKVAVDIDSIVSIALLMPHRSGVIGSDTVTVPMLSLLLRDSGGEAQKHVFSYDRDQGPEASYAAIVDAINAARAPLMTIDDDAYTAHAFDSFVRNPFHGYQEPEMSESDHFFMEMALDMGGEFIDDDNTVIAFKSDDFVKMIRLITTGLRPKANMASASFTLVEAAALSLAWDSLQPSKKKTITDWLSDHGATPDQVESFLQKLNPSVFRLFFPDEPEDDGKYPTLIVVPDRRTADMLNSYNLFGEHVHIATPTIGEIAGRPFRNVIVHRSVDLDQDIGGEGRLRDLLKARQKTYAAPHFRVL